MPKPAYQFPSAVEPEADESSGWIFTFADLAMVMMGFFVMLWVLKPGPGRGVTAPGAGQPTRAAAAGGPAGSPGGTHRSRIGDRLWFAPGSDELTPQGRRSL